ncbi:MAG: hypothetical protein OXH92_09330 [Bryobacterales bacterium]|nr:hypothetical protein [Bryobacterales bacterium]MDE0434195.1 hypothetical protein [Bryobacterales bacterium]
MQFPNLLPKWLRSEDTEAVRYAPKGLLFKIGIVLMSVLMGMVVLLGLLAPDDPIRHCRCPDRTQRLEEAQLSPSDQQARQRAQSEAQQRVRRMQAEYRRQQARRELKAVRTPAADRVRQALKEWEREQAERISAVRAAVSAMEEFDAAAEPAAEVAPR